MTPTDDTDGYEARQQASLDDGWLLMWFCAGGLLALCVFFILLVLR